VTEPTVELRHGAQPDVLDVAVTRSAPQQHPSLPGARRQPVGALDAHQVATFEGGAGTCRDLGEHPHEQGAVANPRLLLKGGQQPVRRCAARLTGVGQDCDRPVLGARLGGNLEHRALEAHPGR
jgi:hypothetical protein